MSTLPVQGSNRSRRFDVSVTVAVASVAFTLAGSLLFFGNWYGDTNARVRQLEAECKELEAANKLLQVKLDKLNCELQGLQYDTVSMGCKAVPNSSSMLLESTAPPSAATTTPLGTAPPAHREAPGKPPTGS